MEWFNTEDPSDEEFESMLDALAKSIANDERRTSILNVEKMKQFQFTYNAIKNLFRDSSAKIIYKIHDPFQSMGSISVLDNDITIQDTLNFRRAVQFASNIEIYPKQSGEICMTLTFHGLTVPVFDM